MAKISGVTIAIKADTSGVTSGLENLTKESVQLAQQLKSVNALMSMDSANPEVQATRQEVLNKALANTQERLKALRGAQEDVKRQYESGAIPTEQYIAFQRELILTEQRMAALDAETQKSAADFGDAEKESGKFGETLKNLVSVGAEIAAKALGGMISGIKDLVSMTGAVAEYGDTIDKTSQKMGMSAQAYQEWDAIMQHSGSDIGGMTTSMKKLAEAIESPSDKTAEAFEKIGISMEKAASLSQEELFAETIKGLQNMESGTERTATATALLGKSAMDLGALLNTSAEDTEKMRQRVHELGGVMSDDAVKASAAYQDSLQDMKTALTGVKNSIVSDMMPAFTAMMDAFTALFIGDTDANDKISGALDPLFDHIMQIAEKITDWAGRLIPSVVSAITRNLPKLLKSATDIIRRLADGLAAALPELLPAATQTILSLAAMLTEPKTLNSIIQSALQLITALTDGLIQSLPVLLDYLPQIVDNIVAVLVENVPKLVEAAAAIIGALAEYIFDPQNVDTLLTSAMEIVATLANGILAVLWKIGEAAGKIVEKIAEKIGLGDYWKMGADIIDQFMGGILDAWNRWQSWWEGFGEYIYDALHPGGDTQTDWENYIGNATSGAVGNTRALIGPENMAGGNTGGIIENGTTQNSTTNISFGNVIVSGDKNSADDFIRQVDRKLRELQTRQNRGIGGVAWHTS